MKPGEQGCGRGKSLTSGEPREELGPGKPPREAGYEEGGGETPREQGFCVGCGISSSVILGTSFIPLNSGFLFCKQSIENPLLLGWVQGLNAHKHLYYAASVEDISNTEADSSGKERTRCRWQRDGGLGKAG